MIKRLLISVVLLAISQIVMSQSDYMIAIEKEPQTDEVTVGTVQDKIYAGYEYEEWTMDFSGICWHRSGNIKKIEEWTEKDLMAKIFAKALNDYDTILKTYHNIYLRNYKAKLTKNRNRSAENANKQNYYEYHYFVTASVVVKKQSVNTVALSKAIHKALQNISQGSRMTLYQINVENGDGEDYYKDIIIEILLDKGYKVVAKEYLERLLKEQKEQTNGIYNDETTVGTGNFTAVGYYVNVRITDESVRVHIVNVETGEYEGNATEKLE